jgi:hypothetical protein
MKFAIVIINTKAIKTTIIGEVTIMKFTVIIVVIIIIIIVIIAIIIVTIIIIRVIIKFIIIIIIIITIIVTITIIIITIVIIIATIVIIIINYFDSSFIYNYLNFDIKCNIINFLHLNHNIKYYFLNFCNDYIKFRLNFSIIIIKTIIYVFNYSCDDFNIIDNLAKVFSHLLIHSF